jgi:hypothetical protein
MTANREHVREAGLDVVAAALDLLSLTTDGMARRRGPVTIRHALDRLTEAAALVEQQCADRLLDVVGYAPLTPAEIAAENRSAASRGAATRRRAAAAAQNRAAG